MSVQKKAVDWSGVSVEHVRRACELYDAGAEIPKRSAQSTFLLLSEKIYPGKFIRGLAYRLAAGIDLDPNRDYSGGVETVRFFQNFGLTTRHGATVIPGRATASTTATQPSARQLSTSAPRRPLQSQRLQEPQKAALADLLRRRFDNVEREAKFPWLTVPLPDQMDDTIRSIYEALEIMRGYSGFASFGKSLHCDFFMPGERLVIEYDERQHFTVQRARALELYPSDLSLGFDRDGWLSACRSIEATDPTPPYRDEQRAFYDSLRDVLAARNGIRLIRLRYGTFDWTGPGAAEQLGTMLANVKVSAVGQDTAPTAQGIGVEPIRRMLKVAVVSHDYKVPDSEDLYDYSAHFARINKVCDEQGCDTVLYALYTWDENSAIARNHDAIFGGLKHVERVIVEVGQPPNRYDDVEVWLRGQQAPVMAQQRFAQASHSNRRKRQFLRDLPARMVANGLLVLCGESGIVTQNRSGGFTDNFGFITQLNQMDVSLILNPIHDFMAPTHGVDMRHKRRHYSQGCRTVISVWNQGNGRDEQVPVPWTVFHDGADRTNTVQELPRPFSERPDIRVGIVDLLSL